MARQENHAQRARGYENAGSRRNPYLINYDGQSGRQRRQGVSYGGESTSPQKIDYEENERNLSLLYGSDSEDPALLDWIQGRVPEKKHTARERGTERGAVSARRQERMAGSAYGREASEVCRRGQECRPVSARGREPERRISGRDAVSDRRYASGPEAEPVRRYASDRGAEPDRRYASDRGAEPDRRYASDQGAEPVRRYASDRGAEPNRRYASDRGAEPVRRYASDRGAEPDRRYASDRGAEQNRRYVSDRETGSAGRNAGYEAGSLNRGYADRRSVRPVQGRPAKAVRGGTYSRRRKRVMRQRLMVGIWVLCAFVLGAAFVIRNRQVAAAGSGPNSPGSAADASGGIQAAGSQGKRIQGLPAEVYAMHPMWEENFLTPNEYSRPGEPLESVTSIFVHYTANPGTSAAQNRSYFEQQKDVHQASVSAHFIIGYEGEIIQCVPLDEIAYAVMTRNYDSISIECCYLAQDGSFTAETYDSLISLLAWLTDAYGLDTEDILRHYDCGGKKCPLYYTENEDEWEQLKKDVDKL